MATTDADEFATLRAFDRYEPIGREAEMLAQGFALLANLILASAGIKGGRIEVADLLPPGTIRPEVRANDAAAVEGAMQESMRAAQAAMKKGR